MIRYLEIGDDMYRIHVWLDYPGMSMSMRYTADSVPDNDQIVEMFRGKVGLEWVYIVVLNEQKNIV
jgi:hypothetical protein